MLKYFLLFACLATLIELASCNLLPPAVDISLHSTSSPTLTPVIQPSATASVTVVQTTTEATPAVTPSFTQERVTDGITKTLLSSFPCDRAAPGDPLDVSITDDTHLLPGQAFSKTWRLVNDGVCTWTQEYAVVYFSGSQMGAKANNNLLAETRPGQNIDISLDMLAPEAPGVYQGNWKLSNAKGQLFGLGPNGDAPFWVRIVVEEPATATPIPPSPVPTETSTPVVYVTGEVTLKSGERLDLDTKTISTGTTSDVDYLVADKPSSEGGKQTHHLQPVNNALLGAPGSTTPPTYSDCQSATGYTSPLTLDGLAVNTTFCYRTNLGLPGWARLVSIDPITNVLTLEILTWIIP